ncbi:MAG: septum formation initiator family protein [Treponema sp.]
MRLYIHILFPFFVMTSVYTLLTFFFGATGIYSQKKLEEELSNLTKNVNLINKKAEDLDIMIKNLTSDEQTIKIFAHDLGYINEGEGIIKLTSFKADPLTDIGCGDAITTHKPSFISDSLCKRFAFLIGLVSLIMELLILKSYDTTERKEKLYSYN